MDTKDYRFIGNALRYVFTKEHPPKHGTLTEYMPSILAISADVIDLYNKNKKMQCKQEIVKCSVSEGCEKDICFGCKKRIFYIYHEKHLSIFKKPEELENKLKIENNYPIEKGNPLCGKYLEINCEIAMRVLYRFYEVMPWNMCYWHIDYYEDILASIFLFCPGILCYAIKKEMNESGKADMHVASAVQKCLKFSIRMDKKCVEEGKVTSKRERDNFYKKTLNEIISFHILRDVEVALTKDMEYNFEIGDVVKNAMEVSSKVVLEAGRKFEEWSKQKDKGKYEKELKNLIGADNYNYIKKKRVHIF